MVTAVMPLVQVSSAASVRLRTSTPASLPAGAKVSTTFTLSKPLMHSVPATQSTLVSLPLTAKPTLVKSTPSIVKAATQVTSSSSMVSSLVSAAYLKPLTAEVEGTPSKPLVAMVEIAVNNIVSDCSKPESEVILSPPPECPSKVDLKNNADATITQTRGPVKPVDTLAQVSRDEGEDHKQLHLEDNVKQLPEVVVPERPHEEEVETSLKVKVDEVKLEVLPPVVSNPKEVTSDTTTPVRSAKPDTMLPSSLYNSCLIDVVARTTTSTSADFNMAPLYTGVAFLSNIPLDSPEHNVSNLRVSHEDFVIPTIGSQEDISQVLRKKDSGDNEGETLCSGASKSRNKELVASMVHYRQSNCGLVEDDSKCTNTKRLNTDKSNNPGCDQNNTSAVSGSEPLTVDQQLVIVSESTNVTVNKQQGNASPPHTLHGQRQQGSASGDMAEMKIADAPGSSLKYLAQKRQSGEERSISPKAAEPMPQEADNIPSTCDGAATPSSVDIVASPSGEQTNDTVEVAAPDEETQKESNNNITSEEAPVDTALPVLEKHERGESEEGAPQDKSVAEPTTDDSTDDMEMPQLTIQAY